MKHTNTQRNIFILILFFIVGLTAIFLGDIPEVDVVVQEIGSSNLAQAYTPLSGKGLTGLTDGGNPSFSSYLSGLYEWGIAVAVILAVISIIWGGFLYMTTDAISGKTDGKNRIKFAVYGLLLALGSWLILQTIDPRIVGKSSATTGPSRASFGLTETIQPTNPGAGNLFLLQ